MKGRAFVVTSVNAERAREVAGRAEMVYEAVGKPPDLAQSVTAVKGAGKSR